MESIGDKLRTARELKKLSIRDVVKDTNINPIYIEALEEEKFDKFPSETYIIGFLKSYAEYLKLDVDAIVKSYKGYKIGESATPLEELTKPTKSNFNMAFSTFFVNYKNIFFVAGVAVIALLLITGLKNIFDSSVDTTDTKSIKDITEEYNKKNKGNELANVRPVLLKNNKGYVLVYKKEGFQFLVDNKEVFFLCKDIVENSIALKLLPDTDNNPIEKLEMQNTKKYNIKGSSRDIFITLKGLTKNRAKIMVALGEKAEEDVAEVKEEDPLMLSDNTSVEAKNKDNLKIIFEADFIQQSFIEIYLDGPRKYRGFVPIGTKKRWEARENIQVKIGNAGGLKARINGKNFNTFGSPGQVVNKIIRWKRDLNNPNLYHIVVKDW